MTLETGADAPLTTTTTASPTTVAPATTASPITTAEPRSAAPYHPGTLPEHLRGGSDKETIDRLMGAYVPLRTSMSERGAVPAAATDYKIEWPAEVAKLAPDLGKDPAVATFLGIAHKHGLTDKQVGALLPEYMSEMAKNGAFADRGLDLEAEALDLLGKDGEGLSKTEMRAKASVRFQAAQDVIAGLERTGALDPPTALILRRVAELGHGVKLVEKIAEMSRAQPGALRVGGEGAPGAITPEELSRRVADPRGQRTNPKFEPAYYNETLRLYQQKYGAG